jgi:hypothetical protein
MTCLGNVQAREAVISVFLGRRLAKFSSKVSGYSVAEIWNVKLPELGSVAHKTSLK